MNKEKIDISIQDGIVLITCLGSPSLKELADTLAKIQACEKCYGKDRLWDCQNASLDFEEEELRKLASQAKSTDRYPFRAALLFGDDLSYGLIRMFDVFRNSDDVTTKLFRDRKRAIEWLNSQEKGRS